MKADKIIEIEIIEIEEKKEKIGIRREEEGLPIPGPEVMSLINLITEEEGVIVHIQDLDLLLTEEEITIDMRGKDTIDLQFKILITIHI